MDINLLALSVGNSRLALGTFVAGELQHVTRVPHAQRADWPAMITQAWMPIAKLEGAAVAAASVNPPLQAPLEQAVKSATSCDIEWIGSDIDLPIRIRTKSPAETGADRILNMAAAFEQMGKACVVIDAGTAITIDCCNDAGEFLGGSISPGVSMQLDALHEKTAKLPRVAFARPTGTFGDTTEQAILHGVYHGVRGMLREGTETYATELGYWPDILATGGDAPLLFDGWELIHAIAPDLTLYGIALAYTEHYIKHGT
ncbi:type III pantothenate kinase [soil metagenome]